MEDEPLENLSSPPEKQASQAARPPQKQPWPFPFNILQEEWPEVKKAKFSFFLCALVFLIVGGFFVWFLFTLFILPGKDETVKAAQADRDLYKDKLEFPIIHATNVTTITNVFYYTNKIALTNIYNSTNVIPRTNVIMTSMVITNFSIFFASHPVLDLLQMEAIQKELASAEHVPIKVVVNTDDLGAFDLAKQIAQIFLMGGFNNTDMFSSPILKAQRNGVTVVARTIPIGQINSAFLKLFELVGQPPQWDVETSMTNDDIYILVATNIKIK
jgi:hypothetical protein